MTKQIHIGAVPVGGGAPVAIQSMCNTNTADVGTTVEQIQRLEAAGCEIIRVAVPDMDAALAVGKIRSQIRIPLVADIHFDYKLALQCVDSGIDKFESIQEILVLEESCKSSGSACRKNGIPIRIGVNGSSV